MGVNGDSSLLWSQPPEVSQGTATISIWCSLLMGGTWKLRMWDINVSSWTAAANITFSLDLMEKKGMFSLCWKHLRNVGVIGSIWSEALQALSCVWLCFCPGDPLGSETPTNVCFLSWMQTDDFEEEEGDDSEGGHGKDTTPLLWWRRVNGEWVFFVILIVQSCYKMLPGLIFCLLVGYY